MEWVEGNTPEKESSWMAWNRVSLAGSMGKSTTKQNKEHIYSSFNNKDKLKYKIKRQ